MHRTLTLDETAEYLHLDRVELQRLIRANEIPFRLQGERVVFTKREIESWASRRILGLSPRALASYHRTVSIRFHDLSERHALMPELLSVDRIEPALVPRTRASALREMVSLADRTGLVCDARELLAGLEEREQLCPTAVPGGVALLHPRHHDPYLFADSFIVLGRAVQPIHAGAPDGKGTDLFFLVCCQDDAIHLHTLARLCAMSQGTGLLDTIRGAADAEAILAAILEAEKRVIESVRGQGAAGASSA